MGALQSKKTYQVEREEKKLGVEQRKRSSASKKEDRHTLQLKEEVKRDIDAVEHRKEEDATTSMETTTNKSDIKITNEETNIKTTALEKEETLNIVEKAEDGAIETTETLENASRLFKLVGEDRSKGKQENGITAPSDEEIKKEKQELLSEIMKEEIKEEESKENAIKVEEIPHNKTETTVTQEENKETILKQVEVQSEKVNENPEIEKKGLPGYSKIEENQLGTIENEAKLQLENMPICARKISEIEETKSNEIVIVDNDEKLITKAKPNVDEILKVEESVSNNKAEKVEIKTEHNESEILINKKDEINEKSKQVKDILVVQNNSMEENYVEKGTSPEKNVVENTHHQETIKVDIEECKGKEENQIIPNKIEENSGEIVCQKPIEKEEKGQENVTEVIIEERSLVKHKNSSEEKKASQEQKQMVFDTNEVAQNQEISEVRQNHIEKEEPKKHEEHATIHTESEKQEISNEENKTPHISLKQNAESTGKEQETHKDENKTTDLSSIKELTQNAASTGKIEDLKEEDKAPDASSTEELTKKSQEIESKSEKSPEEHSEEIHTILLKIQEIEEESKILKEQTIRFTGTSKDNIYLTLNQALIKNMIKLDDLVMENNEEIRNERKRVIKFVQECLSNLERNVEKKKVEDSDSDE